MAILGITDDGVISAANFARLAAVAVAVTNTAAAIEMAEKQEKMAKDYLKIAQEQNQYYYDVYVPCEDAELEEACSAATYEQHQDIQVGRYKTTVRQAFANQPEKQLQCISRYCSGKRAAVIKDTMMAEAQALSAAGNLGRRYEEQYADAKDDLRWARRAQALARGRDMMAQAVNFAGFAYGLFGRLGDQAAKGAAGAIGYLGYASARNETVYPTRQPISRPQQQVLGQSFPLPQPELEVMPTPTPRPTRRIRG
ncbi:TPA: hypothetical protein MC918_004498 [Klebsiella pneumoniae]|jgi:hypothetical protein|nr:MAG: hypothetical protein [Bacteriophage sp.]HBU3785787.1 hypothetical protein [Klebsiella pneumoniae]HBU7917324.1 hypothetical protein [Klebsiella pneumoniae]